jgi:hypothetical protein
MNEFLCIDFINVSAIHGPLCTYEVRVNGPNRTFYHCLGLLYGNCKVESSLEKAVSRKPLSIRLSGCIKLLSDVASHPVAQMDFPILKNVENLHSLTGNVSTKTGVFLAALKGLTNPTHFVSVY